MVKFKRTKSWSATSQLNNKTTTKWTPNRTRQDSQQGHSPRCMTKYGYIHIPFKMYLLVGALSPVNRKGLHQGRKQTSIHLLLIPHKSHETATFFKTHKISLDETKHTNSKHTLLLINKRQMKRKVKKGSEKRSLSKIFKCVFLSKHLLQRIHTIVSYLQFE